MYDIMLHITAMAATVVTAASLISAGSIVQITGLTVPFEHVHVADLSADGSTVVGTWNDESGSKHSFRWTQAGGLVEIGPAGLISTVSGVSGNGSVTVGWSREVYPGPAQGWANSGAGPAQFLGRPFGHESSGLFAVSDDGEFAVGDAYRTASTPTAIRWSAEGGVEALDRDNAWGSSVAFDTSADGSVVVGYGFRWGDANPTPFRWTEQSGMVSLGDFPGSRDTTGATAVSADGTVIVGYGTASDDEEEAFVWTESAGLVPLGRGDEYIRTFATGVSADGSIIVGSGDTGTHQEALLWTQNLGFQSLMSFLNPGQTEWLSLSNASAISADGTVITGTGTAIDGSTHAFVLRIPAPASAGMLALGAIAATPRRR